MTSIKRHCPLLQKGVKTTRKTLTLGTKILVIREKEAGDKRANICSSLGLVLAVVSQIMAYAEKIKQSAEKTIKLRASNVTLKTFNTKKMEQLLTLWVHYLNKKRIHLTQRAITVKHRSLFDEV
jgi:transcriptional regulator